VGTAAGATPSGGAGRTADPLISDQLRRLRFFTAAVAFGETCFFAVLAPLLPKLAHDLGLSETGAGILSAAYPAGMAIATVPAGMAATSYGPRLTARLGMGAVALSSVGFAVGSTASVLVIARFAQGAGAAVAWAGALAWIAIRAPTDRRGSMMGATIGAAFAGTVVAPLLAVLAEHEAHVAVFLPLALALGAVAIWGGPRNDVATRGADDRASPFGVLRYADVCGGLSVMLLVGVLLGLLQSLGPLLLSERGLSGGMIAVVFLVALGPQAAITPALGRVVDRHGPVPLIAGTLLVTALLLPLVPVATNGVAAAILMAVLISLALGAFSPVTVWVSELAEARGADQGLAMAYANGSWGLGAAVGALALTGAAEALGTGFPFGIATVLSAGATWWCWLWLRAADRPQAARVLPAATRGESGMPP
jgi:predicted MFS family arabinose efflux permease